jgi:aspartate aminotransferase
VAALKGPQDHLPKWLAEFDKRRTFAWQQAQQHPGHHLRERQGRVLPVPEHRRDRPQIDRILRQAARNQEKVAAVPGIAFGADDYIRLSYATSMANIEKGLDRLDKFCRTLKK